MCVPPNHFGLIIRARHRFIRDWTVASCDPYDQKQGCLKIIKLKVKTREMYVYQYKISISFQNKINGDCFIQCKTFCNLNLRIQKTSEVGISSGVVKDINRNMTEDEIIKNLTCDVEIKASRRLNKIIYNKDSTTG